MTEESITWLKNFQNYYSDIINEDNAVAYISDTINKLADKFPQTHINGKENKWILSQAEENTFDDFEQIIEDQILQIGLPFMGLPGLTVTTDRNENRPVGVQLVASHFREDILLDAAKLIAPRFDAI